MLAVFAIINVILGYNITHNWVQNNDFALILHFIIVWIFLGILVIHCILSQKYLKLWVDRIIKELKSKNKNVRSLYLLRLIQLISNRAIIIIAVLAILSGLGFYDWYAKSVGKIILFRWHFDFDLYLSIFIIIHVATGAKFFFIRRKIFHWSSNLFIILLSSILVFIVIFLNL